MDFAKRSKLFLPPLSLSASAPPALSAAARRRGRPQATSCFARRLTWHLRSLWTHFPTRCTPPPLATLPPASSVVATSPPPWPAQRRASAPQLARAPAPGGVPHHIPLLASLALCPKPPEHRRRPPSSDPLPTRHGHQRVRLVLLFEFPNAPLLPVTGVAGIRRIHRSLFFPTGQGPRVEKKQKPRGLSE